MRYTVTEEHHCRYRNRVEFKGGQAGTRLDVWQGVDIGTEWNLKVLCKLYKPMTVMVDIGTEWNLKA